MIEYIIDLLKKPKEYSKNIMIMVNVIQIINIYILKQVIVILKLILVKLMEDIFVELMENGIKIIV
jgi:hypothetical protein